MKIIEITRFGQINKDDLLLLRAHNKDIFPALVKEVLVKGSKDEEIIISAGRNLYFSTRMFLEGRSWVKECRKIINGKMFSISNNMNYLP